MARNYERTGIGICYLHYTTQEQRADILRAVRIEISQDDRRPQNKIDKNEEADDFPQEN